MNPLPPPAEFVALARRAAEAHALWPELVCAIVEQESSWNPWALRYEPAFYEKYIARLSTARPPDELCEHREAPERHDVRGEAPRLGALTSPSIPEDPTESRARAFSWGLMQVMGQVAREHGFDGASLAALCDPATGIEIGCRVFAAKLAAAEGNVARALLLWNGGANPDYPAAVLARAGHYT